MYRSVVCTEAWLYAHFGDDRAHGRDERIQGAASGPNASILTAG
jgi:hypothetical protein